MSATSPNSTEALLAIINNILDLATIDAGAMTLELCDVDIRDTMQAAAEGVRDRLAEQNLEARHPACGPISARCAPTASACGRSCSICSPMPSASRRAARPITLSAERRDDAVIFRVADKGPGIPPEVMERVFDRFETHARGSKHRGAGLGLSIVRSFVELHGGSVDDRQCARRRHDRDLYLPARAEADHEAAE